MLVWEKDKFYNEGDTALCGGILYKAKTSSWGSAPPSREWVVLESFKAEVDIEEWVADTFYEAGTVVEYEDKLYKSPGTWGENPIQGKWEEYVKIKKAAKKEVKLPPVKEEPKEKIVEVEKIVVVEKIVEVEKVIKEPVRPPLDTFWIF